MQFQCRSTLKPHVYKGFPYIFYCTQSTPLFLHIYSPVVNGTTSKLENHFVRPISTSPPCNIKNAPFETLDGVTISTIGTVPFTKWIKNHGYDHFRACIVNMHFQGRSALKPYISILHSLYPYFCRFTRPMYIVPARKVPHFKVLMA